MHDHTARPLQQVHEGLGGAARDEFEKSEHFDPPAHIETLAKYASEIVSQGNQTGEGWFLTGEMLELIHSGAGNIVCTQPFACLPNHVVGKGVIKELRRRHPESNIVAIDFDPGASEVNQLNRIKLMLSTAFKNLDFLHSLNLGLWKIPSGEITNYPFIKKIASFGEPVIMSTGMCDEDDIRNAMAVLTDNGLRREQITILHCNTQYPTPMADVNLRAMLTIKRDFGVEVGYSDHTQGIEVPIAAVALGAAVVEKHFTLDRAMKGPDHKASLEPKELKAMTAAIRNIEQALGTGEKCVSASERANIAVARKSIVAACTVKKGDILTDGNLAVKRPGTGISPMRWNEVVGTRASKDFEPDEMIVL